MKLTLTLLTALLLAPLRPRLLKPMAASTTRKPLRIPYTACWLIQVFLPVITRGYAGNLTEDVGEILAG